ncbi:PqqD family peptide modification chaperone [Roseovarius dicentrarchi]|uniref:PqqD family peptide modification chaperone n=1 Tax=Roseovarius dicentrarchi TaxID=2250573 RepID=UPI000DEB0FA9|nr:PqqD family peptide modification chaperone [Roseovarius dicentrarchi]
MAGSFLSTIWYRVAKLQPRLRAHVRVHRHRYRGQSWYVLHDHASGRVHRFTPAAYMFIAQLDGGSTVDEVWRRLAESHALDAPGQDDVIQLLSQLHQSDLIQYPGTPDVADLLERHGKQARQVFTQNLTNPMSFRVPLWDPDRFLIATLPAVRWLTGWFGLFLWIMVVGAGLTVAAINWERLTGDLSGQLLSASNLIITLVSYPLLKALHELAHGWLLRARGGEVREMGIMFLVFFPVPYVDASTAAAFRSKWHRAAVSAGGIFVETFVAAIAVMVWASAEPGMVRAVAFNLVMVGGISTVLVNGNPLLKFDGYYVLSDVIEIPNLATRATRYWGHLVQRYIFGARQLKPGPATAGEKVWFLFYAPAAYVYRLIVMVGIALFVAQKFFVLGVLLACWSVFSSLIKPMAKNLRHVVTAPALRKVRRRAMGWTFGSIAILLMLVLLVPVPLRTDTEGVIWLPEAATLRAGTGGFLSDDLTVSGGAVVAAGDLVAVLEEPRLHARLAVLEARLGEATQRLAQAEAVERLRIEGARLDLEKTRAELSRERDRLSRLQVMARLDGAFRPSMPVADLAGRWLAEGDVLGHILPPRAEVARLVVRQDDIALVRDRLERIQLRLAGWMGARHDATLIRAVPQATFQLPAPALGSAGGGRLLTDPADREGLQLLEQAFVFDVALPDALADAPFGARVYVRFDHGFEPASAQIWRRVRQLFLRQFNA